MIARGGAERPGVERAKPQITASRERGAVRHPYGRRSFHGVRPHGDRKRGKAALGIVGRHEKVGIGRGLKAHVSGGCEASRNRQCGARSVLVSGVHRIVGICVDEGAPSGFTENLRAFGVFYRSVKRSERRRAALKGHFGLESVHHREVVAACCQNAARSDGVGRGVVEPVAARAELGRCAGDLPFSRPERSAVNAERSLCRVAQIHRIEVKACNDRAAIAFNAAREAQRIGLFVRLFASQSRELHFVALELTARNDKRRLARFFRRRLDDARRDTQSAARSVGLDAEFGVKIHRRLKRGAGCRDVRERCLCLAAVADLCDCARTRHRAAVASRCFCMEALRTVDGRLDVTFEVRVFELHDDGRIILDLRDLRADGHRTCGNTEGVGRYGRVVLRRNDNRLALDISLILNNSSDAARDLLSHVGGVAAH